MNINIANYKINKLCKIVISKDCLLESDLNAIGFSKDEIEELITNDILFKIKEECYFIGVELLYQFGKHLENINIDLAKRCYEKCLEIDKNFRNAKLGLLFIYLKKRDKTKIYEILIDLLTNDKDDNLQNDYLYLKMLGSIYPVCELLRQKFNSLKMTDVILFNQSREKNDIRALAFKQRNKKALNKLLKEKNINYNDPHYSIFRELLFQTSWVDYQRDMYIVDCLKDNNYEEIVNILKKEECIHSLSKFHRLILKLSIVYLDLKNTGYISPIRKEIEIKTTYDAYLANDYKKALELTRKEDKEKGYNKNMTAMILEDICALMDFYENNEIKPFEKGTRYGISNEEIDIIEYAISFGENYLKILKNSGYTLEQQDIISLIIAQDYYKNKQYDLGDMYLNLVLNKRKITYRVQIILEQTLKMPEENVKLIRTQTYKKTHQI